MTETLLIVLIATILVSLVIGVWQLRATAREVHLLRVLLTPMRVNPSGPYRTGGLRDELERLGVEAVQADPRAAMSQAEDDERNTLKRLYLAPKKWWGMPLGSWRTIHAVRVRRGE